MFFFVRSFCIFYLISIWSPCTYAKSSNGFLNIGDLIEELKAERKEETETMFEILEKLKKIVENPDMSIPSYGGTAANLESKSTLMIRGSEKDESFYSN